MSGIHGQLGIMFSRYMHRAYVQNTQAYMHTPMASQMNRRQQQHTSLTSQVVQPNPRPTCTCSFHVEL